MSMARTLVSCCLQCGSPLVAQLLDDPVRPRLKCSRGGCPFIFYDNPIPVVAAIVELDGQIVLVRNVGWPDNMFGLVTGFLEAREDPAVGILREVREELGLTATVQSLIGVYPFQRQNHILIAYHVVADAKQRIVLDPKEIAAFKLVPPHRLVPWDFGTGLAVKDWLIARARTGSKL